MGPSTRGIAHRVLAATLLALLLLPPPWTPPAASAFVADTAVHPPPSTGAHAYYATFGTFGPDQAGFPGVGQSFVDPVFGSSIRRLTNEVGQSSESEIYAKNGYFNADGTRVHHRAPNSHTIVDTTTGQVVRAGVAFNYDSSFAPDDADAWYAFTWGDTTLYRYSVSTGARTAVKTFPGALGPLGGSVDWIDRSGRYMVLSIGGASRVYDRATDTLYAGSIPGSYGGNGGWIGISPDGSYVITSTPPVSAHSWRIDHAARAVSTTPVLFWTLCGGHGDLVSASDGKTYYVTFDCHTTGSIYRADVSLPQSAGNVAQQLSQNRKLVQLASWADVDGHFSGVSKGPLQDWVYASIESGDDGFTSSLSGWRAYKQELLMMNVVSGEVRRLAHHRSRGLTTSYFAQPRVSASWDGSVVVWTSNFGLDSDGYADLYALRVDTGGGTTPPAPTVAFTSPASGATVSGTVAVAVTASGGSGGGYTYVVKAGGTTIHTGTGGSFSWNTTTATNGPITLTAAVTDSAGGSGSGSRTVTVNNPDTVRPTVTIGSPATGTWASKNVKIAAAATDDRRLTKLELWANGGVLSAVTCTTAACSISATFKMAPLGAGAYQVHAVAVDAAGNRSVSAPVTIYKGATSPVIGSGAGG